MIAFGRTGPPTELRENFHSDTQSVAPFSRTQSQLFKRAAFLWSVIDIESSAWIINKSVLFFFHTIASSEDTGRDFCEEWTMFTSSARPGRSSPRQSWSHVVMYTCRRSHRAIIRSSAARHAQDTRVSRATHHWYCIKSYEFNNYQEKTLNHGVGD